jgi:hypothetical protein
MPFFSPSDGGVFGILWSLGVAALRLFLYPIKALQSKNGIVVLVQQKYFLNIA